MAAVVVVPCEGYSEELLRFVAPFPRRKQNQVLLFPVDYNGNVREYQKVGPKSAPPFPLLIVIAVCFDEVELDS